MPTLAGVPLGRQTVLELVDMLRCQHNWHTADTLQAAIATNQAAISLTSSQQDEILAVLHRAASDLQPLREALYRRGSEGS